MLSPGILLFLIFLLSACSVQCILLAVLYPRIRATSPFYRRFTLLSAAGSAAKLKANGDLPRKRTVEATLRDAADRLKSRTKQSKPRLQVRLRQAQLSWSKTTYFLICTACGLAVVLLTLGAAGLGGLPAVGFGISGGLLLPHFYVNFRRRRHFKRFTAGLPDAVDIIVRGVKVGQPLVDCFNVVADEARSPVKDQFKLIVEDQAMGMTLADAAERLPQRISVPEARFFAIVLAIQSRTGGSVAEALANLSNVLRARERMFGKIRALSTESKVSAAIIGSLPLFVMGTLLVTSPQYVSLLFITQAGHIVLVASAVWMFIGVLIMRKMVNFEV